MRGLFPQEEWRPVVGHEGRYEVSSLGRVRSLKGWKMAGQMMKVRVCYHGYARAYLSTNGKCKSIYVHRLVLEAFVGPKPSRKHQSAHNDGNRTNNTLANLRWATPTDNARDRIRHGTYLFGETGTSAKLTACEVIEIRRLCSKHEMQMKEIAALFGVEPSTIYAIRTRKSWKHL